MKAARDIVHLAGSLASEDTIRSACDEPDLLTQTDENGFGLSYLDGNRFFKTIMETTQDGIIIIDADGSILYANSSYFKMTGYATSDLRTLKLRDLIPRNKLWALQQTIYAVIKSGAAIIETVGVRKDGSLCSVEVSAARLSSKPLVTICFIRDYTEKKVNQKEIEYLSYHDRLTGLYNRRYMEDSIKRLDTRRNHPLTLLVLDVNGLKLTNDAFGYEVGDHLLQTVAGIMKKVCRADDIIGRMGGDEFCVLLPHTDDKQADSIRNRIKTAAAALKLDPVVLSLAIGHAAKTSPGQDMKTVITEADNRMHKDKIKYGKAMRSQTIEMVLHHINANYHQEHLHTEKVSQYCEAIAKEMNFSRKDIRDIKNAAALHDIGKIMIPHHILNKPDKLTPDEFTIIKRHPEIGYQMLTSVDEYVMLAEFVLHHHERWDGTGYPSGLSGDNIPLYSRIIAVADAFEAMTALRPYQKTKSKAEAIEELVRCAGIQFDPDIVTVFISKILPQQNLILRS